MHESMMPMMRAMSDSTGTSAAQRMQMMEQCMGATQKHQTAPGLGAEVSGLQKNVLDAVAAWPLEAGPFYCARVDAVSSCTTTPAASTTLTVTGIPRRTLSVTTQ